MLTIRTDQMNALAAAVRRGRARAMVPAIVTAIAPGGTRASPSEWSAALEQGLARGEAHGIASARSLALFAALCIAVSPQFDRHPACRSVLENARLHPNDRLELLFGLETGPDWEEVAVWSRDFSGVGG
jgi:hypothetical protein